MAFGGDSDIIADTETRALTPYLGFLGYSSRISSTSTFLALSPILQASQRTSYLTRFTNWPKAFACSTVYHSRMRELHASELMMGGDLW